MRFSLSITCLFLYALGTFAQKGKLNMGDKIPFSKVTVLNQDKKATNIDLPDGKVLNDRFVLVYFYSAASTVKELIAFNNEVEKVLNRYENNPCKGAQQIEYVTICIEKDYGKWMKLLAETNFNKTRFSGKKTNYKAKDGPNDKVVKAFRVTRYPSLFLVNPKGRLYIETDSISQLEKTFQNICRVNAASSTADISGKLLVGDKKKAPLPDHQVYLVKENKDTIKQTSTDLFGDFYFKQVDTTQNLSIRIAQNEKTKSGAKVFLAKQNGELVSEFKKTSSGTFEYKLLSVDVERLADVEEEDITVKYKKFSGTAKKDLTVAENIYYESGQYTILTEGEIVLDKVITILNAYPLVKLDVISHTDSQGDNASNLKLSQSRSAAVIDYLVSKGIARDRLKAVGKGESEIRNRCVDGVDCSDKEHEYNRRTEFKFMKS